MRIKYHKMRIKSMFCTSVLSIIKNRKRPEKIMKHDLKYFLCEAAVAAMLPLSGMEPIIDRKSTRLNSSH